MVDATCIGLTFAPHSVDVEAGRLRLFAKAIGETRDEYLDEAAARAAGHPSLPAPPTYVACLYFEQPDPFAWLHALDIDIAQVLHAAQGFRYFAIVYAGDRLTFSSRISNCYQKKGGALTLLIKETDAKNQQGALVAVARATLVVRGG